MIPDSDAYNDDYNDDDDAENPMEIKWDVYKRDYSSHTNQPNTLHLALFKHHHSLWGEYIYNAARVLADRIDTHQLHCQNKTCLELGAGAGLPGVLTVLNGANTTVITDYGSPFDMSLLSAININIEMVKNTLNCEDRRCNVIAAPYIFGNPVDDLLGFNNGRKYDILLMADIIFNRSEHKKLLWTIQNTLQPVIGEAWITFSHHDPNKKHLDLQFFKYATDEFGFEVIYKGLELRKSYPFTENDGLDDERGIVYTYIIKIPSLT
jgi:nicotinamide N-methyltransferase